MSDVSRELHELFDHAECAACAAADLAAHNYVRGVVNDGVNDPVLRARWRREGGLCREHWQVLASLDTPALSAAILGRDLLEAGLRKQVESRATRNSRTGLGALSSRSAPTGVCPACAVAAKAERHALGRLNRLRLPEAGLGETRGFVCLAHLENLRNEPLKRAVRERLRLLVGELDEFIRKSDYRFAGEPKGAERDSWLRVLRVIGRLNPRPRSPDRGS